MARVLIVTGVVCTALWIYYPMWMLSGIASCLAVLALLVIIDRALRWVRRAGN